VYWSEAAEPPQASKQIMGYFIKTSPLVDSRSLNCILKKLRVQKKNNGHCTKLEQEVEFLTIGNI
jgi:hypothetical protein